MNPVVLCAAFFSLLLGLSIYFWASSRNNISNFYTTIQICWLLIALFPVLLIFSFFPDSSISGTIKGVSIGGAIGAFELVWWYGTSQSLKARTLDDKVRNLRLALDEKTVHLNELESALQSDSKVTSQQPLVFIILNRDHKLWSLGGFYPN